MSGGWKWKEQKHWCNVEVNTRVNKLSCSSLHVSLGSTSFCFPISRIQLQRARWIVKHRVDLWNSLEITRTKLWTSYRGHEEARESVCCFLLDNLLNLMSKGVIFKLVFRQTQKLYLLACEASTTRDINFKFWDRCYTIDWHLATRTYDIETEGLLFDNIRRTMGSTLIYLVNSSKRSEAQKKNKSM